jgi:two-component system sensor histidine kinase/response regulator
VSAIARARGDLDRALAKLEVLADDDRKRVTYSVHALNNYLMVVATTLQLVQSRLRPRGDGDLRGWLDSLKQATNLMMTTARGVLTAAPELPPSLLPEEVSLTEIAAGACRAYRDIAQKKGIRIAWRAGRPERVLTDRVAAGAVLDNLLSNAIKYSPNGATISVTMSVKAGQVTCSVRDSGAGLSELDQTLLYQRGVRLSTQPTGGEQSTGYGLAIAKDLATALQGRLSCTSALGQGSCFAFSLPVMPAAGTALGTS